MITDQLKREQELKGLYRDHRAYYVFMGDKEEQFVENHRKGWEILSNEGSDAYEAYWIEMHHKYNDSWELWLECIGLTEEEYYEQLEQVGPEGLSTLEQVLKLNSKVDMVTKHQQTMKQVGINSCAEWLLMPKSYQYAFIILRDEKFWDRARLFSDEEREAWCDLVTKQKQWAYDNDPDYRDYINMSYLPDEPSAYDLELIEDEKRSVHTWDELYPLTIPSVRH